MRVVVRQGFYCTAIDVPLATPGPSSKESITDTLTGLEQFYDVSNNLARDVDGQLSNIINNLAKTHLSDDKLKVSFNYSTKLEKLDLQKYCLCNVDPAKCYHPCKWPKKDDIDEVYQSAEFHGAIQLLGLTEVKVMGLREIE